MPKKRRKPQTRRPKRHRRYTRLLLVLSLILSPAIVWYVGYGIVNRPLVDYSFGVASEVHLTYRLDALSKLYPGTIDILNVFVRNRGHTEIKIIVTVHAVNALVPPSYSGPYNEMASTALVIPADMNSYRFVTFYLTLRSQVPSFTLSCQAGRLLDFSTLNSSIGSIFGSFEPTSPNLLQYSQQAKNSYDYQLVQQS